jgi:hypothetical protein
MDISSNFQGRPMVEAVAVEIVRVVVLPSGRIDRANAAKALGRSTKTLSEWARKGVGPAPEDRGGRIFYKWSDVQAFMGAEPAQPGL